MEQQQPDTIRGSMYERAFRFSAERSAVAGVFVFALALSAGIGPAAAQGLGRPSVVVDESVLDQLGPPPQTLPDVILHQQQHQTSRPAQRVGSDAAAVSATPGRLLPPPRSMPKSRVMLPNSLQSAEPEGVPAARPQTARAPKVTTPKVERLEPPSEPPVAAAPAPSTVPAEIVPPTASVPKAPSVTPPPPVASAPEAAGSDSPAEPKAAAPAETAAKPAVPTPPEPKAAKAETPDAPPPPPSVPKLVPPAPADAAKATAPQPAPQPAPEAASIPAPPAVEPPPAPAAETPPAPVPSIAGKAPSPRVSKPMPALAEPAPPAESRGEGAGENPHAASQIAALPPAAAPEVLDDGQLYRVPFGSASSEISEEGKKHLDTLADRLKKDDSLRLQLLGYASGTQDSASKARRTALFRALSVRTYLMKQGIRSTRMDVRALGNLSEGGDPDRVDAVIRK
jgi:outer membrane protein OmpA-like peptidoglycan-associated protein